MTHGNHISGDAIGHRMQKRVAQLTRHIFHRSARVARSLTHIGTADLDRQPQCRRQLAAERLITVRIRAAQLMVEVRDAANDEVSSALQIQEQM